MANIVSVDPTTLVDAWRTRTNELIERANALGEANAITITGGAINNTTIGTTTPTSGRFTTLKVTQSIDLTNTTIVIQNDSISGDKVHGGTISDVTVELPNAPTLNTHATNKAYVDDLVNSISTNLKDDMIAYAIFFGG